MEINNRPDEMLLEWVLRMPDEKADELLVDIVMFEMRKKLAKKRNEGRGGWHGPNCSSRKLKEMLLDHIGKGDMIDVINLAAMVLARQKLYGED